MTLSVILPRRGWTLVKQAKNYAYFKPPTSNPNPPFFISIAIPSTEECLAIARRFYANGRNWLGQLGEWPASYSHERNKDMVKIHRDKNTGLPVKELLRYPPESSLHIGEWGVWSAAATAIGGDFVPGIFARGVLASGSALEPPSDLWEGEPIAVELNTHERNSVARRKCIEHFGPTCQACGLNYEQKYGPIGAGLIHVHHIVPIAEIGEAYVVDPIRDLVPLCATCHHVVHIRNPPYSVDELKMHLAKAAGRAG